MVRQVPRMDRQTLRVGEEYYEWAEKQYHNVINSLMPGDNKKVTHT